MQARVTFILSSLLSFVFARQLHFRNPSDHDHPGVNQVWPEGTPQTIAFTFDDTVLKDFTVEQWVNCTDIGQGDEMDRLAYLESLLPGMYE
jgi:hypothetical protein